MQITITGRHFEITDAIRDHIHDKLQRLERHFDKVMTIHITLWVEKQEKRAEGSLYVDGSDLHAQAVHNDMYAALDALADKLDRQVTKHKEKIKDHHRDESVKRAPVE